MAAFFWSLGGVLNKLIPWSGLTIAALRSLIAAITIGIVRKSFRVRWTRSTVLAGLFILLTTVLYMIANKLTSAANAIVLQYTTPLHIIVLSLVVFKQKPRKRDLMAIAGVALGIALFFADQLGSGRLWGDVLALGSGMTFAGVFFANKLEGASPVDAAFLGNALGIVLLPFLLFDPLFWANQGPYPWITILVMGIFQQSLGYLLFSKGIKMTSATTSAIIATLEPILNPIWVFLVIGESPSPLALLGGAIVLATVLIYNTIVTKENYQQASLRKTS
jgi:drug/metabolite transporter (DMT)-like permease